MKRPPCRHVGRYRPGRRQRSIRRPRIDTRMCQPHGAVDAETPNERQDTAEVHGTLGNVEPHTTECHPDPMARPPAGKLGRRLCCGRPCVAESMYEADPLSDTQVSQPGE